MPVALALYQALKGVNRNAMLLATAFVGIFVVLDLAVTWSHYASILTLYRDYSTATDDAHRAGYVAAANYASAMLTSPLERPEFGASTFCEHPPSLPGISARPAVFCGSRQAVRDSKSAR